ncbi:MAG: hypothetical protein ABIS17_01950 [Casimicrobiaceae bacterium]
MVSIWWIFVAFVIGGYFGAILVGMLSMAEEPKTRDGARARRAVSRKPSSFEYRKRWSNAAAPGPDSVEMHS